MKKPPSHSHPSPSPAVRFRQHGDDRRWQDRHRQPRRVLLRQPARPGSSARTARHHRRRDGRRAHGGLERDQHGARACEIPSPAFATRAGGVQLAHHRKPLRHRESPGRSLPAPVLPDHHSHDSPRDRGPIEGGCAPSRRKSKSAAPKRSTSPARCAGCARSGASNGSSARAAANSTTPCSAPAW